MSWARSSPPTSCAVITKLLNNEQFCGSAGEESAHNAVLIPGLGRSPGEGNSHPLRNPGLENSMDCIGHGVAKSWTRLSLSLSSWLSGKESACNAGDSGSIPGLGRFPGEGHGNPLQYSYLENPCGQRSLAGCSPWGRKSQTQLSD